MNILLYYFLFIAATYLLAGIPFAYITVALFFKKDIRKEGSGNVGATNVYRIGGLKYAAPVFVLDFLKGLLPVLLSVIIFNKNPEFSTLVGIVAVLGHMYSPYLKFQGGKGAATSFGAFVVIFPINTLICAVIFAIVVMMSRIVALGTIIVAAIFPLLYLVLSGYFHISYPFESFSWYIMGFVSVISIFIIYKHKSNIIRLVKGNENKI